MKRKSIKLLVFFEIAVLLLAGLNIVSGSVIFKHAVLNELLRIHPT